MPRFPNTSEGIKLATEYIISNIKADITRLTYDPIKYPEAVTAIFMAGAPGSGKTEFIESVLNYLNFFFIDVDSYRNLFEGYVGNNADEYQEAMSKVVNGVLHYCLSNNVRFILDGTFKSGRHSLKNIEACKKLKRKVDIYYIFQNPSISHYYTFLREIQNTRKINVDGFVDCFYRSILNIYTAHNKYRGTVNLYICEKTIGIPISKRPYIIHNTTELGTIEKFCIKFNIAYNGTTKEFKNRERLRETIQADRRIFTLIAPILRLYYLIRRTNDKKN